MKVYGESSLDSVGEILLNYSSKPTLNYFLATTFNKLVKKYFHSSIVLQRTLSNYLKLKQ